MIEIIKAKKEHVKGIVKVCREAQWATYRELYSKDYIEHIIQTYYTEERVLKEVLETSFEWGGWFVAIDEGEIVGACGGSMINEKESEIYVLYLKPNRRNEGIGSKLLEAVTKQQVELGATKQWVSVAKGNEKGIPFYEARGFTFQREEDSYEKMDGEFYTSLRYFRPI